MDTRSVANIVNGGLQNTNAVAIIFATERYHRYDIIFDQSWKPLITPYIQVMINSGTDTALIAAFIPGASPPEVSTPILVTFFTMF